MNVYILIIFITVLLFVSYNVGGHSIRPSCALLIPMLISALVVAYLQIYLHYEMSFFSVTILSLMMFFYLLGEIVIPRVKTCKEKECHIYLYPKNLFKKFALVIEIAYFYFNFKYIMEVGSAYGVNDILSSYAANRLNTIELQQTGVSRVDPPGYLVFSSIFAVAIEIICMHILIYNKLLLKEKFDKYLLTSVIIFFLTLFFNSGRAAFVPVLVHLCYLLFVFSNMPFYTLLKKYRMRIVISGLFFISVFLFLGNLRESSTISGDINTEVDGRLLSAIYVGGPLVGFDIYATKGMPPKYTESLESNKYFGQMTFKGIYDVLRKIGINSEPPVLHEEKFSLKNVDSNVYTGFCHIIRDFGLLGGLLFCFIMGGVIAYIDLLIKIKRIGPENIIAYFTMSWLVFSLLAMFYTNEFYFLFSVDYVLYRVLIIYLFIRIGVKKICLNTK